MIGVNSAIVVFDHEAELGLESKGVDGVESKYWHLVSWKRVEPFIHELGVNLEDERTNVVGVLAIGRG